MTQILINDRNSLLWVYPNYGPDLFEYLSSLLLTKKPPIFCYGSIKYQHRDIGFFSNESKGYYYSGNLMPSQPLTPLLAEMLNAVNKSLQTNFNGILINRYNNGEDYIGKHSDSEDGLDKNSNMVASIAYGAVRKFRIRDRKTSKIILDIQHQPQMLLVMQGDFQKVFTHEIPVQKTVLGTRISITFRRHIE